MCVCVCMNGEARWVCNWHLIINVPFFFLAVVCGLFLGNKALYSVIISLTLISVSCLKHSEDLTVPLYLYELL